MNKNALALIQRNASRVKMPASTVVPDCTVVEVLLQAVMELAVVATLSLAQLVCAKEAA